MIKKTQQGRKIAAFLKGRAGNFGIRFFILKNPYFIMIVLNM